MAARLVTQDNKLYVAVPRTRDGKQVEELKEVIAGWESYSGWYWFSLEKVEEGEYDLGDGRGGVYGETHYGFVQGFDDELGYFNTAELNSMPNQVWSIPLNNLPFSGRRD